MWLYDTHPLQRPKTVHPGSRRELGQPSCANPGAASKSDSTVPAFHLHTSHPSHAQTLTDSHVQHKHAAFCSWRIGHTQLELFTVIAASYCCVPLLPLLLPPPAAAVPTSLSRACPRAPSSASARHPPAAAPAAASAACCQHGRTGCGPAWWPLPWAALASSPWPELQQQHTSQQE